MQKLEKREVQMANYKSELSQKLALTKAKDAEQERLLSEAIAEYRQQYNSLGSNPVVTPATEEEKKPMQPVKRGRGRPPKSPGPMTRSQNSSTKKREVESSPTAKMRDMSMD